jgi:hypothetical protein
MEDDLLNGENKCKEKTSPEYQHFIDEKGVEVRTFIKNVFKTDLLQNYNMVDFLTYVKVCWMREKSVYLTPDFVQNAILNSFANISNENDKKFVESIRHLFTTEKDKKEVKAEDPDTSMIAIINNLYSTIAKNGVNTDLIDIANTEYSTDTDKNGKMFSQTCILDVGRSYFHYSYYGSACGIKSVEILGSIAEWEKLKNNIIKFGELVKSSKRSSGFGFNEYINKCIDIINKIIESQINPTEETTKWLMSGISATHYNWHDCGEYTEEQGCPGMYRKYKGHYYYPTLIGWMIYLTNQGCDSSAIDTLENQSRIIPFTFSTYLDPTIKYKCIRASLQFSENKTDGKNWEYTFTIYEINKQEYDALIAKRS